MKFPINILLPIVLSRGAVATSDKAGTASSKLTSLPASAASTAFEDKVHVVHFKNSEKAGNDRELTTETRRLKTRALDFPECLGMDLEECRQYITDHIDSNDGHVLQSLQLILRTPRPESLEDKYWMYNVASNFEIVGQPQCQTNNRSAIPRASTWEYADGTSVALEEVDCSWMTNAECCDAVWSYGESLGLDKNGKHLMCYVHQEPMYPFFAEENGRQIIKYPDYVENPDSPGNCMKKNYRFAPVQRQYKQMAYDLNLQVVQKIDHLLEPTALTGYCSDSEGNDQNKGLVVLNRGKNYGPEPALQQACLKMCQDYEIENGIEINGCEPIWRHGGRGCYAFKSEVTQSSGVGRRRACFVDPIRPAEFEETCAYLKALIANIYNYARIDGVMELAAQINAEYCANGEETFKVVQELKSLLIAVKDAATYTGATPIPVINFVYIVGDDNGKVATVPKIATNNPAFQPILADAPMEW